MPQAACTWALKFLASVAITAPWLNPPTSTPLLQSALAREQSWVIALTLLLGSKMHLALPEIWEQVPNSPLSYWMPAATNPRLAMPETAAAAAPLLLNVSEVPTIYTKTGKVPVAEGSWPTMLKRVLQVVENAP